MNRHVIMLTLLLSITPLFGMETDPDNNNVVKYYYEPAPCEVYPDSMGYIPLEDVLAKSDPIPPRVEQAVTKFLSDDPEILTLCSLSTQIKRTAKRRPLHIKAENLSRTNYVYDVNGANAVIKLASLQNSLKTAISALSDDPYGRHLPSNIIEIVRDADVPRHQQVSTLATMELLERADSSTIVPVPTWAYHIPGQPDEFQDENYITVQEKLDPKYKQFSALPHREKHEILFNLDLAEVYRVLKYANLWNPSESNLWINTNNLSEIAYPDGEKPNNEGAGKKAFRRIAIFGQQLDKAKFNIRNEWDGGHRGFENTLKQYCPERAEEWMAYYLSDPEVQ